MTFLTSNSAASSSAAAEAVSEPEAVPVVPSLGVVMAVPLLEA
jgi:hypothetical protein